MYYVTEDLFFRKMLYIQIIINVSYAPAYYNYLYISKLQFKIQMCSKYINVMIF